VGRLLALPGNIELCCGEFYEANTLAYLSRVSVTNGKKFYKFCHLIGLGQWSGNFGGDLEKKEQVRSEVTKGAGTS
jgi:hypothetical protein